MPNGLPNPRFCWFCKEQGLKVHADGPTSQGKMRVGGGNPLLVGGEIVDAGTERAVCEKHRAMIKVTRALARKGGHAARKEAERNISTATAAVQDSTAAREARWEELYAAAYQTMDALELDHLRKCAGISDFRTGRGTVSGTAWDDVQDAFAGRIADAALSTVADDVNAQDAVRSIDRGAVAKGLGHVHATRTGARDISLDQSFSNRSGAGAGDNGGAYGWADSVLTTYGYNGTEDAPDAWVVAGRKITRDQLVTLARKMVVDGHPLADVAAEVMAAQNI